jgi:hypothetical protein
MSTREETISIPTGTWHADVIHSPVGFEVPYMGISTFSGTVATGQLNREPADLLSVDLDENRHHGGNTRRWNIDGVEFDVETAWGLTVARGRFDRVVVSSG